MNIFGLEIKRKSADMKPIDAAVRSMGNVSLLFSGGTVQSMDNLMKLYRTVSEVRYPIDYIADRCTNAEVVCRRYSDDSITYDIAEINKLLSAPNNFYSFKDFIKSYVVSILTTGNAYIRAAVDESFSKSIWKYASDYYVVSPEDIFPETKPFFSFYGGESLADIVKHYRVNCGGHSYLFPVESIMHARDTYDNLTAGGMRGYSRLLTQKNALSNLLAVYEARNIIYTKHGALGIITSELTEMGNRRAMDKYEKESLQKTLNEEYGLEHGKNQYIISDVPINFVRIGSSISELQPFEECFQDAVSIAGIYGVPSVLIPRKDQSTFTNMKAAEVTVYNSVVRPLMARFTEQFTEFLGLREQGLYLDCLWDGVAILAESKSEETSRKAMASQRCRADFWSGLITMNDWRAELGLEAIDNPLYDTTVIEMDDNDIMRLKAIMQQ